MKTLILAGGAGTRLRSVVPELPKPLAPVAGKPFLMYQLDFLKQQGVEEVYFSLGYKGNLIETTLGTHHQNIALHYIHEPTLLGTGGAIKFCLNQLTTDDEPLLVLNGDTYFNFSLQALLDFHQRNAFDCSIALYEVENSDRYGTLTLQNSRVLAFHEKQSGASHTINAGVYFLSPRLQQLIRTFPLEKFSWEKEILEQFESLHLTLGGILFPANFIDIGIPEDYEKAQTVLPQWSRVE